MKNINELLNELEENKKEIERINNLIKEKNNIYSYKSMNREEYYIFYKENKVAIEKNNLAITTLKDVLNKLNIKTDLIINNIKYIFDKNYKENIKKVLNKYVNKRVGEKTEEKIEKEISDIIPFKNRIYLYLNPYNELIIDLLNIDITIEYNAKYQEELKGFKWFNDNKGGNILIELNNINDYIENYDNIIDSIISTKEKIENKIQEVNNLINEYEKNNYHGKYIDNNYSYKKIYESDYIYR